MSLRIHQHLPHQIAILSRNEHIVPILKVSHFDLCLSKLEEDLPATSHKHRAPNLSQAVKRPFFPILTVIPLQDGAQLQIHIITLQIPRLTLSRRRHPAPPLLARPLLLLLRAEKRVQKRCLDLPFLARQRQLLKIRRIPLPHAWSRTRPRPCHHQPPHQGWRLQRNQLRNITAHGEAEDVDGREAEGADDLDHVVGPDGEGVWDAAGGGADADVVDEQDGAACGNRIQQQRVPVVHRAAEVHVEDEGNGGRGRGGAEEAVCEADGGEG